MRIAVWHNLPSGGGKRALHDQVRGLVGRGHQVEAWRPPQEERDYLPLSDLVAEHEVPLEAVERPPLAAGDLNPRLGDPPEVRRFQAAYHRHCARVADLIHQGGFDLVFVNSCRTCAVAPLGQHLRLPSVLYLQEPQRWLYEVTPPLTALPWVDVKLWGRYWWTPTRLRHAAAEAIRIRCLRIVAREELDNLRAYHRVLVNSYFSRENLLRSFGVDARVCYLGIDTERFRPLGLPREDRIVGLGAFGRHKHIELAIQALAALPEPRPRLTWIGNAGASTYIEELKRIALSESVDFEPRMLVTDEELVDILNRAAMMLYTSRLEPFGYAPLEANACGTPVVAVAEGGVRETVVDGVNGLLRDAEPAQLAEAVQRLREDAAFARRVGEQGREYVVREWGIEPALDRLEARFRELVTAS